MIRAALAEVDLTASADVELIYGWRNGTSTAGVGALDDIHMFPGFSMLSLEDAVASSCALSTDERWTPGSVGIYDS